MLFAVDELAAALMFQRMKSKKVVKTDEEKPEFDSLL
jgi:hypothetical protein